MTLPDIPPMDDRFRTVRKLLAEGAGDGTYPGATLYVSVGGQPVLHDTAGVRRTEANIPPDAARVDTDTLFDIASVTKAMSTATLLMGLVAEGKLSLSDPVSSHLPAFKHEPATILHLATHSAGLPAWKPFFRTAQTLETEQPGFVGGPTAAAWMVEQVCRTPLERPPGEKSVYSDLGFILLGHILEKAGDAPLDDLFRMRVATPMGLTVTRFNRGNRKGELGDNVAAAADHPWRGGIACGVVDDDNCYTMGGVAGHAGLFSTAAEVGRWGEHLISAWHGNSNLISRESARRFLTRTGEVPGSGWAIGFDTPAPSASAAGNGFGTHSVGHLGFTGTSVWIDLDAELCVVLLTNRVHPDPENRRITRFRPRLHDAVTGALAR